VWLKVILASKTLSSIIEGTDGILGNELGYPYNT